MYTCQKCNQVVLPNTKAHRIAVEIRNKHYPERSYANRQKENGKIKWVDDPGGTGYETVRELIVCPDCAAAFHKNNR